MYPRRCKFGEFADSAVNGKCTACPNKQYCGTHGLSAGTQCPNGYNCVTNTTVMYPNWHNDQEARYHLCTEGNYCDQTMTPTLQGCPEGTFMPRKDAGVVGDCVKCPPGFMCTT